MKFKIETDIIELLHANSMLGMDILIISGSPENYKPFRIFVNHTAMLANDKIAKRLNKAMRNDSKKKELKIAFNLPEILAIHIVLTRVDSEFISTPLRNFIAKIDQVIPPYIDIKNITYNLYPDEL